MHFIKPLNSVYLTRLGVSYMRSKHLLNKGHSAFNSSVLLHLKNLSRSSIFGKMDTTYTRLKATEINERIAQLQASLPSDPDILFRGTEGTREVLDAMQNDSLGMSSVQRKKGRNHDIVAYIRENDSRYFFSTSPCKFTVQPYAADLSLIPCKGFIWVMGLPKVYTCPQKLLHLNREMFEQYDRRKIEQQDLDSPTRYDTITEMTAHNNEVTVLLGAEEGDDWSYKVSQDVMKVIQVSGPGRVLGPFMSSREIVHVKDWQNPDFKKRVWAMEVILSRGEPKDYDKMYEKARQFGLITPDQRLLTLEDARAVVDSEELSEVNERYKTDQTHRLMQVPKEIALGQREALVEYMLEEIQSKATLEEIMSPVDKSRL